MFHLDERVSEAWVGNFRSIDYPYDLTDVPLVAGMGEGAKPGDGYADILPVLLRPLGGARSRSERSWGRERGKSLPGGMDGTDGLGGASELSLVMVVR